ncbi:MAG TPA: DUF2600 family protein [Solirubrobacteraceae bacterium]|nr:DUF2600 family protein [Solirubrobacteraceae bacterium]
MALAVAHGRYWSSVAPHVRRLLTHWQARAAAIPDPALNLLARAKLRDERFNVEVAAMVATAAPAQHRARAVEAIVALQVMYDYLDGLTERPSTEPVREGLRVTRAFVESVSVGRPSSRTNKCPRPYAEDDDGGYLAQLAATVRDLVVELPSVDAISRVIPGCAARCAEAQVRAHAVAPVGLDQLESWAMREAEGGRLQWREWLFGAMGSVVAAHALIALAADEGATAQGASELDSTYLSLCVLTTALDHLVDYDRDALTGEHNYLHLYATREELAERIALIARCVKERVRTMPNGPHHAVILSGVVAYYTSQPGALGEFARPVTERVRDELRPLITPTLATMYAWRAASALRRELRRRRTVWAS